MKGYSTLPRTGALPSDKVYDHTQDTLGWGINLLQGIQSVYSKPYWQGTPPKKKQINNNKVIESVKIPNPLYQDPLNNSVIV